MKTYAELFTVNECCEVPDDEQGGYVAVSANRVLMGDWCLWELIPLEIELSQRFRYHVAPSKDGYVILKIYLGEATPYYCCDHVQLYSQRVDDEFAELMSEIA